MRSYCVYAPWVFVKGVEGSVSASISGWKVSERPCEQSSEIDALLTDESIDNLSACGTQSCTRERGLIESK